MTEERDDTVASGEEADRLKSKDKDKERRSKNKPFTKIILRHLPPSMTEQSFLEQVSPIPEYDYFYFFNPDPSLMHCGFSRAYINFVNIDDIYLFKDKFDGYIFLDEKGQEYIGIVEYAPFQRVPKKQRKKDPKCGTIENDPEFEKFLESLKEPDNESREPKLEYSYPINDNNEKKTTTTPLLEFLASRKLDKRNREERRKREADKRKVKIDKKTKEATIQEEETQEEVKKIKPREWEKDKPSKNKDDDILETKDTKNSVKPSRSFRENRKSEAEKDYSNKEYDSEKRYKKEKRDKIRESSKEQKLKEVKKYSEVRKEKSKEIEAEEIENTDRKATKIKDSDIKPFTQLPPVKTEDLTKLVEEMDRMMKLDEGKKLTPKFFKSENNSSDEKLSQKAENVNSRRKSLESSSNKESDENQNFEDRSKSIERDSSVEKDKGDPRTERRIRNKDRPSMVIYQPGMGKFSKQRIAKDKENQSGTEVDNQDKRDT